MRSDTPSDETGPGKRRSWYFSPFRLVARGVGAAGSYLYRKGRNSFRRLNRKQSSAPYACISTAFLAEEDSRAVAVSAKPKEFSGRFPMLLDFGDEAPQTLLTVGHKCWGNGVARGLLRIKVYDFALYANSQQIHQLSSDPTWLAELRSQPTPADRLLSTLKRSPGLEMTVILRAARDLPVHTLASEYQRVLAARFLRLGGSVPDPALTAITRCIASDRLPPHSLTPGLAAVKKGEQLVFRRTQEGGLQLHGGGQLLTQVHSPVLAQALLDLYIGADPTSDGAKEAAGRAALCMLDGPGACRYTPHSGQRLRCEGAGLEACVVEV